MVKCDGINFFYWNSKVLERNIKVNKSLNQLDSQNMREKLNKECRAKWGVGMG